MPEKSSLLLWFKDVDKDDIPRVGGKGANLGEMTQAGFPVPRDLSLPRRPTFNSSKIII